MNVLAFDTATEACTVALQVGERVRVDHRVEPRRHAQLLLPMIEGLLADAGLTPRSLDALVYGRGPGSFTGVRIAVAAAQGFAFAADLGTVGVSTLAAIAEGCRREHGDREVVAMLDARMGELYVGRYRSDGRSPMRAVGDEGVLAPADAGLDRVPRDAVFAGAGAATLDAGIMAARTSRAERLPDARDLLRLAAEALRTGDLATAAEAQPVYLRDKVALTERERGAR